MRHRTRLRPQSHSPAHLGIALAEWLEFSVPAHHFLAWVEIECDEIRADRPKGLRYSVLALSRPDHKSGERRK